MTDRGERSTRGQLAYDIGINLAATLIAVPIIGAAGYLLAIVLGVVEPRALLINVSLVVLAASAWLPLVELFESPQIAHPRAIGVLLLSGSVAASILCWLLPSRPLTTVQVMVPVLIFCGRLAFFDLHRIRARSAAKRNAVATTSPCEHCSNLAAHTV